jgi:mannobiose 2-epimerase
LAAADLGYRFLRDKMWDAKHGGFYWLVDESGNQALLPGKVMYGQSFGLYAVSEYYLATRNEGALKLARQLFDLMEAKAHDPVYGGYQEKFAADWSPSNLTREYFGAGSAAKLMNTHLHLMEAMTCFYRASRLPLARERLLELITIQSNSVVRKGIGACTDRYERNWQPILTGGGSTVSYGHDLENIWLLVDASDAAGISVYPLQDLFQTLFEYSTKYGFDTEKGGFYSTGAPNQPASDRSKTWWVQAEAMVSALYMHRLTGDPKYLEIFAKTYDFIDNYQVDWKVGEWHPTVSTDGKGSGSKANAWKAGYHNGRAMIEGIAILKKAL